MTSAEIRKAFLDFFRDRQHEIVPSAPMVVKNDPTLMFTNAGMNPFKDIFLGNREAVQKRVADTQKCLRVSGKHNDLEEVGHDTYHHTMFEMLGNWSFGDYFKKEAIDWAWEFLTGVVKIDPERLYVTVFEGDPRENLSPDEEALAYWKAHLPAERILYGSKKDNFWEMGDSGPCGPCSEIHADIRDAGERQRIPGKDLVNKGDPHVIEIWNLVFIQYNRLAGGQLTPLPARHVDTGMGFERLCMVLQGVRSNYDTDIFQPMISAIAERAGIAYGRDAKSDIAMRVIADHIRAIAFAIADGQLPSNVKAGYVIRRILRRAVRYGYAFLGFREPFLCELIPVLNRQMGAFFPELIGQNDLIINVIREEESTFLRTLSTGIHRFSQYLETAPEEVVARKTIDGDFAFELYDTYGFPIDLTGLMAREAGWEVDMEGFARGLEAQKARSRQDAVVETSDWIQVLPDVMLSEFTGYDETETRTRIARYRRVEAKGETRFQVVLERTPFYAESGGQVGDRGWILSEGERLEVIDTIRENDLILHILDALPSNPSAPVNAGVDRLKRLGTANNHTATHLMHAALRQILGTHVEQKGSLVDENRLRFDFTHFARLTREEIRQVERTVNQKIREDIPLSENRSVPLAEAKAMGAMALFGEKYGENVRVVTFDPGYSVELCGGTHVAATGRIGLFRIVSEGAIAAGIRRIEAVTAGKAEDFIYEKEDLLQQISESLKNPRELLKSVTSVLAENADLRREVAELGKLKTRQVIDQLRAKVQQHQEVSYLIERIDMDPAAVKDLAYEMNGVIPSLFQVYACENEGKALLTVMASETLVKEKGFHAGQIIRDLAREVQGGGGGQPHIATAGGKDPSGIPAALEKARLWVLSR